jgi:D-alanyl-D-alanine carboxypeptidase
VARHLLALGLIVLALAPLGVARNAPAHGASLGVTHRPAAPPLAPEQLEPGSTAIVRGEGDCLRVRDAPNLSGARLTCVADGSTVLVLEGTAEADGHTWQRVQAGAIIGWAADTYLAPAPSAPACDLAGASSLARPGLAGDVPPGPGVGLVVWGGGTAQGIAHAASLRGSNLRSVWATHPGGGFVGHIFGAPDFVNRDWFERFPGGRVPAATPLLVHAVAASSGQAIALEAHAVPPPAPSSEAPVLVGAPAPEIDAAGAVVIDEASGAVLFDHNAYAGLAPASLTKIATAILAIEGSDLDGWATSDIDHRTMPGSSVMGLLPGDCFPVRDLLYGLMLPSGNDAALAIGRYVAGSDAGFVSSMNALVARLGLTGTRFENAHGLDGSAHRSSAYDLAMLARYGMALPEFAATVAAPGWTAVGSRELTMRNVNRFLSAYPDADGVKTGFTGDAGRTLVASATRDGRRLYVVLLDAPNRFTDAATLLDWAFEQHRWPGS